MDSLLIGGGSDKRSKVAIWKFLIKAYGAS